MNFNIHTTHQEDTYIHRETDSHSVIHTQLSSERIGGVAVCAADKIWRRGRHTGPADSR